MSWLQPTLIISSESNSMIPLLNYINCSMSFVNITRMFYVPTSDLLFWILSFWCKTTLFHVSSVMENTVPCPIFCQPSMFNKQNSINIIPNMQISSNDVIEDIINCQCDFFRNFYEFFHKVVDVQTFKIDFLEITKTGCGTVWFSWHAMSLQDYLKVR